jgi:hypothetical protein
MTHLRVTAEPEYVSASEIRHDHRDCSTIEAHVDDALHVYCQDHRTYQIAD